MPSLKTTSLVELDGDIEGDSVVHGDGVDDGAAGSVPCAHLPMDIPFDDLLNDVLQDDALEHVSHVDDLAHVASADDSTGIYRKDLPEHILAASVSTNSLNEDIFENVPSIGMFYN